MEGGTLICHYRPLHVPKPKPKPAQRLRPEVLLFSKQVTSLYYHSSVYLWLIIRHVLLVSYELFGPAKGTCWNNRAVLYVADTQLSHLSLVEKISKFVSVCQMRTYAFGPYAFRD